MEVDIVKMSFTQLMLAAIAGDLRGVWNNLGEAGRQDEDGWTALMWAVFCGNLECARCLLSEAGKQSTKESISFPPEATALMLAAHYNHPEVVELLLPYEQGLTDSEGNTAEWYANNSPERGDFDRVRELLRNEGSDRLPPPKEELPLMISAVVGDVEGVRKYSNHVGYRDPTGTTALMLAAKNGHTNCIPMLEKEMGMQDNDGRTALLISLQEGHVRCARLLADEAAVREKNGQLHLEGIQRLVWKEGTDSTLAKTYRAVSDILEAVVMRQVQKRLEMLAPHHITPLLPPIDQFFEGEDAQELGDVVWSALFGESGALEALDDVFCEIEDEMVGTCAVCLLHQKNVVLLPCRHLVICEDCADRIEHYCPYCRTIVDEAIVLEYPEGTDM